jgi:anthranilate synthase/phosphoribosyltransferase
MILIIDNFDSFTFNIYQYIRKMNYQVTVIRNTKITTQEIKKMNPSQIIISPGPGRPESAGISVDVVKSFKGKIPILGICLGNQCIAAAFGADIVKAARVYHGKISEITHDGNGIFNGIKNPFTATRYHSLVIKKGTLPEEFEISAMSEDDEIMAIRHKTYPIVGVQFHPESIGSPSGYELLHNFITQEPKISIMQSAIKKVFSGKSLTEEESQKVMEEITSGDSTPAQIASILTALSLKKETVSELTGFVKVMREKASVVQKPKKKKVIDTCGTGGDSSGTFNISTVSAFVVAGAGITVAKHGNRSITSRCGSADVLEALGVNISLSPELLAEAMDKIGIAFLFAPGLHQSMKHAVPVRIDMGVRTAFNILGPLTNPARADYQIIGVFEEAITEKVAKVLANLGMERAMVVHGCDGLDEITLTGKTKISELKDGWIKNYLFEPTDYDFYHCSSDDLKGGEIKTNCEIALSILGGEKGPKRDVVVLNAAAAIYLADGANSFQEAINMAQASIDEGAAMKKLKDLVEFSNK